MNVLKVPTMYLQLLQAEKSLVPPDNLWIFVPALIEEITAGNF